MARDSKGITQFYLPPTQEPYLPLLFSCKASPPFWLVLITPTHEGMTRLSWPGWLVIYWFRFSRTGSWTQDTVTNPSTNRARCRLTSVDRDQHVNHYAKLSTGGNTYNYYDTTANREISLLSHYKRPITLCTICSYFCQISIALNIQHPPQTITFFTACHKKAFYPVWADIKMLRLVFTARHSYASAVLRVIILSVRPYVCHTRALWQNQTMHCGYFDTTRKGNHSNKITVPKRASRGHSAIAELLVFIA